MKLSDKQIECAVTWWSTELLKRGASKYDIGDPTIHGGLIIVLAQELADSYAPTAEQIELFQASLYTLLIENNPDQLDCDYQPDYILSKAAQQAGIDESVFPFKTMMTFEKGCVSVSEGYGSPFVFLLE